MPPMVVEDEDAIRQATWVEIFYLLNISFLPVIGFLIILIMKSKVTEATHSLSRSHITQSINASIWAGILMLGINGLILSISGIDSIWTWMYVIIYFTCIHSVLIIFGVIAISRAQGGRYYRYPYMHVTCNDTAYVDDTNPND